MLGRQPGPRPARLDGHAVRQAAGQSFPLIVAEPGAVAEGIVVRVTEEDRARLDFYETGFGYGLQAVTVETAEGPVAALFYRADPGVWQPGGPWSLADWVAREAAITVPAAAELMAHFGRRTAAKALGLYDFYRARAWARHIAQTGAPRQVRSALSTADTEVLSRAEGYDGFFRIAEVDIRARRFDGGWSDPMPRETFISYDAALVLPYDPRADLVLLVEQFRCAPFHRGDPYPWVLEPVAGLVDAGEDPADTARREAVEEAGLTLGDLMPIARVYASPGYSTEFFHCFLGLCDLARHETVIGGLDSENENIRSHVLPFEQALALIETGEVNAGPLAMMLLWLATRREELRASA